MSDVSRETPLSGPPAAARELFGALRLPAAERYVELLAGAGTVRGLIGPREVPRLWERHLLNCAVLGELVPNGASVCDVGSGAGLPGLVLALARPDLQVTLVEPSSRRTTFLEEAVAALELDRVEVVRSRAEEIAARRRSFDVVTSRALAPWARLVGWCLPLVAESGVLLAMKGSSARAEIESDRATWESLGCSEPEVVRVGVGTVDPPATVVRASWASGARVRWLTASDVEAVETGGRSTP